MSQAINRVASCEQIDFGNQHAHSTPKRCIRRTFLEAILDIGNGAVATESTTGCIQLPTYFCKLTATKTEMIRGVFPDSARNHKNLRWISERIFFSAVRNVYLNSLSSSILRDIPGGTKTSVNYPTEFLNSFDQLCNGTRLSVKCLYDNVIEATILIGKLKGDDALRPQIPMVPTDMPFQFESLQFPVRIAFAMTINKAQRRSWQVCG